MNAASPCCRRRRTGRYQRSWQSWKAPDAKNTPWSRCGIDEMRISLLEFDTRAADKVPHRARGEDLTWRRLAHHPGGGADREAGKFPIHHIAFAGVQPCP